MREQLIVWHRWLPPREEGGAQLERISAWRREVEARFEVVGGRLLGSLGASLAARFDPEETVDVLGQCLELLAAADAREIDVCFGVAVGPVRELDHGVVSPAIELAQLLANRARPGELVLDPSARDLASEDLLMGRQVAAGAGAPRGTTVDRAHPRRSDNADAIAELRPPSMPPIARSLKHEIERALTAGECRTFILRGPVGGGATELLADLEPPQERGRMLRIGAAPGGMAPLASLRLGLLRRFGTPLQVKQALSGAGATPGGARVLARVAAGELVPLSTLSDGLVELLEAERAQGRRSWLVLSPLSLVDGATLGALLEARRRGGDFVLFGRYPMDLPLPRPLAELDEPLSELTLPPLKTSDARVVAEAVLGDRTDGDVARRVAVLGGDTVLGVVEAARTLIATGELVREGEGFVWRAGPRKGADAASTQELLTKRLELLDASARRVLEALCVVPDGSLRGLLQEVASLDGIAEAQFDESLRLLEKEALARGDERPRPASSLLRWSVLSLVPPARAMELHRFVGEALRSRAEAEPPLRAELGFYLVEGGLDEEGRQAITEVIESTLAAGYERAARQLSGWLAAVKTRREEAARGQRATPVPPPPEALEEGPPSSEISLDELLEEAAAAAPRPPPPPPPAPPPPPPPASRAAVALMSAPADPPEDTLVLDDLGGLEGQLLAPPVPAESVGLEPVGPAVSELEFMDDVDALLEEAVDAELFDDGVGTTPGLLHAAVPSETEQPCETSPSETAPSQTMEDMASERTSVTPAPVRSFVEEAVRAFRERDFEALEATIGRAIADGGDLGAVGRVRAVAELARGDLEAARGALREARERGRDAPSSRARSLLAEALLDLRAGEPMRGVRGGLAALAVSRTLSDPRGESAALHTLAACFRALGRDEEAAGLDAARPQPAE